VEETLPLPIAGHDAVYLLKRSSARRTLALRVTDRGEIAVNAPLRLPQHEVDRFLQRHADWLKDRLESARTRVFTWRDGAELPWLGGRLTLGCLRREADPPRARKRTGCCAPPRKRPSRPWFPIGTGARQVPC
jgi:predicted metal-dependent hydrolase